MDKKVIESRIATKIAELDNAQIVDIERYLLRLIQTEESLALRKKAVVSLLDGKVKGHEELLTILRRTGGYRSEVDFDELTEDEIAKAVEFVKEKVKCPEVWHKLITVSEGKSEDLFGVLCPIKIKEQAPTFKPIKKEGN